GAAVRGPDRHLRVAGGAPVPVGAGLGFFPARDRPHTFVQRAAVRRGRLHAGGRLHRIGAGRPGAPIAARATQGGRRCAGRRTIREYCLMELIYAAAVGILAGSGVWLILRPRTFQVIMGLTLVSYAVNLFIFGMGRLTEGRPPIIDAAVAPDPAAMADPLPQ